MDPDRLRTFVATEYPRVVGIVALLCGDASHAEDSVQEALARACEQEERGVTIQNLAAWVTTVATNDAALDADDAVWTASGGAITARYAIIFNDTDTDDPPVAFVDFGASQSAADGSEFRIQWSANGIITFAVA